VLLSSKPARTKSVLLIHYYSQELEEQMIGEDFSEAEAKSTVKWTHSKGKAAEKVKV